MHLHVTGGYTAESACFDDWEQMHSVINQTSMLYSFIFDLCPQVQQQEGNREIMDVHMKKRQELEN